MKENIKNFYNRASFNAQKYWNVKFKNNEILKVSAFAERSYKGMPKGRKLSLLDLGCGDGRDSRYFSKKGLKVTAIDYSSMAIKKAQHFNDAVRYFKKDLVQMIFPRNRFDVVYSHLGLHFFNNESTKKIFKNIHKTLKKNGLFFVKVKSIEDKRYGIGEKIDTNIYMGSHLRHFFSKDYLSDLMKDFNILRIRKISSSHQVIQGKSYKASFIEAVGRK